MATAILLPAPELQFCDADGKPYAGGTIATYVPGTTTPKATWVDPNEAALNTNPIILDAAGRCIIYGDGDYRLILRDAAGNLIYDQLSSTVISAAMEPVVSAPTIADAVHLLGLDATVTGADLSAAISAEQTSRIAADNAEAAARSAEDTHLQSEIDALTARVTALEGAGGTTTVPSVQHGAGGTGPDGHARVSFGTAYSHTPDVAVSFQGNGYAVVSTTVLADASGFDIWLALPAPGVVPAPGVFYWIAVG